MLKSRLFFTPSGSTVPFHTHTLNGTSFSHTFLFSHTAKHTFFPDLILSSCSPRDTFYRHLWSRGKRLSCLAPVLFFRCAHLTWCPVQHFQLWYPFRIAAVRAQPGTRFKLQRLCLTWYPFGVAAVRASPGARRGRDRPARPEPDPLGRVGHQLRKRLQRLRLGPRNCISASGFCFRQSYSSFH